MTGARHYISRSWCHFLPHKGRLSNLRDIADVVKDYDIVGLQEVDAGSMRSSFINQVDYLAARGDFLCSQVQVNRNLKPYAMHANGVLSRYPMSKLQKHRLPSKIPGRGAITFYVGQKESAIMVVIAHLALTPKTQKEQLSFIAELIKDEPRAVVMGDFNVEPAKIAPFLEATGLCLHDDTAFTYPSWKPKRKIDYILSTPFLNVVDYQVLPVPFSDHLPVAMTIEI